MPSETHFISTRFWGRMAKESLPVRIAGLVFVAASIASLSFSQLGFWTIGDIDGKPVYLMLILGPLVMGAFLYGPLTGSLIGLFAGTIVFAHAAALPLDFYEIYFMSPLNTFVLLTVLGALSGLLFNVALRGKPQGVRRVVFISVVCLVVSFAASALFIADTVIMYGGVEYIDLLSEYLLISTRGLIVQALIDAALMALLCWLADFVVGKLIVAEDSRKLLAIFRNWMLLVSSIVFMVAGAIVFSVTTIQEQSEASTNMMSEVYYLTTQIDKGGEDDPTVLLKGYTVELDGSVVITDDKGTVLATCDEQGYPVGASLLRLLGYEDPLMVGADPAVAANAVLGACAEAGEMSLLQAAGTDGAQTMDVAFLAVSRYDGGYAAMVRSPEMVYAGRFGTMVAITLLAALLIGAIGVLATVLLNRVVVRRVDETNGSLAKITAGDLSVRVDVHDTAEFTSLSSGINKTVSALRDTIAEVEQRNAQDLATAKAIQESVLPREFPPFPEIGRFDIYASMKTAKEVGGDFYDFFLIEESGKGAGKLGFVMADVSGKGIPAALFMMTAKTQIRNYMEAGLAVNEAIDAANHQLCIGNDAGMFVTVWAGVLDYATGLLKFVNAGHNPPLLLKGGEWEWVRAVSGMPLGLFDGIPYDAHELQLEHGGMLYTYTDGVTEAMDTGGNLFGEERLLDTLRACAGMNPRSVGVGVRRALTEFTLDAEQSDDITMLALKYGVPPEKRAVMVLPARDTQLVHVYNFIHEELKRRRAPKSVYNPHDIAAEELFVNVCHYAYPHATPEDPGEVRIGFEYEAAPPSLTVTISDDGVPYDPLAKPDAVTPDDIADVPIGGLGILMAKRSVDDMRYERVGDSNVVTFVKRW